MRLCCVCLSICEPCDCHSQWLQLFSLTHREPCQLLCARRELSRTVAFGECQRTDWCGGRDATNSSALCLHLHKGPRAKGATGPSQSEEEVVSSLSPEMAGSILTPKQGVKSQPLPLNTMVQGLPSGGRVLRVESQARSLEKCGFSVSSYPVCNRHSGR